MIVIKDFLIQNTKQTGEKTIMMENLERKKIKLEEILMILKLILKVMKNL